ncbi:hypothetical protein MIR68_011635 [Amoeboaphelidium protococcarum]|nr:hypothetical protein MIR68_011635 [Amoeboaphelidium protococcarum]KAI3645722.1 hypothetical protein MP228_008650 [Amoeboaphelidium protococcarum]
MNRQYVKIGEDLWKNKVDKINGEMFTFTYGALVTQLIKDLDDFNEVNKMLDRMGFNIGIRLIEDFLSKAPITKCSDFRETVDWITKVAFKMFLNISPLVSGWSQDGKECVLTLDENPLAEYVEFPPATLFDVVSTHSSQQGQQQSSSSSDENKQPAGNLNAKNAPQVSSNSASGSTLNDLWWSNIYCGVLRGALEMVQMQVEAAFISDVLRGDDSTQIKLKFVKFLEQDAPPAED